MIQGEKWIIFYTDGSLFCSADGTPWDAPRRDVQVVVSNKESKASDWYSIQQLDYYYYELECGGWNDCSDLFTLYDHLLRAKHPCIVFGRMLSDSDWKELFKKVNKFCEEHRQWIIGMSDERPPQNYS